METLAKLVTILRNVLKIIVILFFVCVLIMIAFLVYRDVMHQVEESKMSRLFTENQMMFEEIVGEKAETAYEINTVKFYNIPSGLQELGITSICL